jgi:ABC-type phosphate transport system substrate-binding protein
MALSGITSPVANKPLLLFDQFVANTAHDPLVRYCHKVDPEFAALIPIANPPVYPAGVIAASYATVDALNSAVADTSFSFAMTVLSNAVQIRLPIGAMINRNGAHILPTANAMWLNLYELGTDGYDAVNVGDYDLTNPSTAQAWPLLSMSWLILDKTGAVSTCANKKMVLNFLTFFYTDGVVDKIAASLSTSSFPLLYVDQLGLIDQLRQELTCLGSRIYTSDTSKSILAVNALVAPAMTLLSSFYTSIDTSVVYTNAHAPERLAVQRVALGEQDMALVNGAALSDEDVAVLAEGHTKLIPGFLAGVVPIFTLPFALTSFYALPATADLGLPPLYPLRLDLELAARLFIGEVSSWLDADLVALNPQLPVWFTHSGADPTLQLIVGATAVDDPLSGAKLLFQHFRHTKLASDPAYAYAFTSSAAVDGPQSNPFLSIIKHVTTSSNVTEGYHANITLIESESRLAIKSAQVGGSVSYKHLESLANPLSEFFFVSPLPEGADPVTAERTVIDSSVASMAQCGTRLTSPPGSEHWSADEMQAHLDTLALPSAQRAWVDGSEAKCWPLSTLLSFAVKTEYSDSVVPGSCAQSLHSLEFIN